MCTLKRRHFIFQVYFIVMLYLSLLLPFARLATGVRVPGYYLYEYIGYVKFIPTLILDVLDDTDFSINSSKGLLMTKMMLLMDNLLMMLPFVLMLQWYTLHKM